MNVTEMPLETPRLCFPDSGWTERFDAFVKRNRWIVPPRLNPGATVEAIGEACAVVGELPPELRALYESADGGHVGFEGLLPLAAATEHTHWLRGAIAPLDWAGALPAGVARSTLIAVAEDGAGNFYAYAPSGAHRVVYLCHDPLGWRHDFTSLGAFIDAILLRALARAEHQLAEAASGNYVDDARWIREVHSLESRIDPGLLRTRTD